MRRAILAMIAVFGALACGKGSAVDLQVRILGDQRKTPMFNPGSGSSPSSSVDVLMMQADNATTGASQQVQLTNDFTVADQINAGKLQVTPGDGWKVTLTGFDRYGYLYSLGRSTAFTVPKTGSANVPVAFGIADDFATSGEVDGGMGPFASANALADGSVLMVGLAGPELHVPTTGQVCGADCLTGELPTPRMLHAAVTLSDGRVFIAGGQDAKGNLLSDAFVYDPSAKAFSKPQLTGVPLPGRVGTAAALLQGGQVLLAGGTGKSASDASATYIVDLTANTVTAAPALPAPVLLATATVLNDGTVLVAGGLTPGTGAAVATTSVYTADGTKAKAGAPLLTARGAHSATLLADGYVLIYGGIGSAGTPIAAPEAYAAPLTPAVFVAVQDQGTLGALPPRAGHAAVALGSGDVILVGGELDPSNPPDPGRLSPVLRFTSNAQAGGAVGAFSLAGTVDARTGGAVALLVDGSVVTTGGARDPLGADPTVIPAASDWTQSLQIFVPCATQGQSCPR